MRVLMLCFIGLSELLFTLVALDEVASLTVLGNTSSKSVVVILGEGFNNGVVLILRPQAFF